ncbi:MAG: hypothetical protein VW339_10625 [Quisquiliibacterium sp.]
MDEWSHRIANLLVGNDQTEASLEITLMGPSLRFERDTLIAITGADLSPRIGQEPLPQGCPVFVRAGSQLDFGKRVFGCRAYTPPSRRAGCGAMVGRPLHTGPLRPNHDPLPAVFSATENSHPARQRLAGLHASLLSGDSAFAAPADLELIPHPAAQNPDAPIRFVAGQPTLSGKPKFRSHGLPAPGT